MLLFWRGAWFVCPECVLVSSEKWNRVVSEAIFNPKQALVLWTEGRFGVVYSSGWRTLQVTVLLYCEMVFCFLYIYIYISPFLTGCDSYGEESHRGVFSGCMVTIMFSSSCLVYYFERDLWIQLLSVVMSFLLFTASLCYLWYGCFADTAPWLR